MPGVTVVHSPDDASICGDADVVVVVVGYTAHDEGEYLGDGLAEVVRDLMPPLDHPVLGSDDPAVIEALASMAGSDDNDAETTDSEGIGSAGMATGGVAGGDRESLRLRADDEALIAEVCATHERVVVTVVGGSAVVMPWLDQPAATIMMWYAGSEGGTALGDVLLGTEPGGRLPFAVPVDESQLAPFDRLADKATYTLLHGQWLLDATNTAPHLPFGHGLSYASFTLEEPQLTGTAVRVEVANTSERSGSAVVFVFGSVPDSAFERPEKRLVGFTKVTVGPSETTDATITVDLEQLDVRQNGAWLREDHDVVLHVGFDASNTVPVSPLG